MAFASIEPFGEAQADYRAGLVAASNANATGNYKKQLTPNDFIYIYTQPKQMSMIDRRKEQQRQMNMFKALAGKQ
jgi:hypothetical protein